MTLHLMCVYIISVRFGLLSGQLLRKSCSHGLCISTICNFSFFYRFGFKGWICFRIASVPGLFIFVLLLRHVIIGEPSCTCQCYFSSNKTIVANDILGRTFISREKTIDHYRLI